MPRPFVVLLSFPPPKPTTNPYSIMLADSLAGVPGVEVLSFSWRTALLRRYDVFHVHWPEILVSGHSPAKKLVRQALFVALLAKLRLTRTPLVRTVHNLELPQGISRREVFLLRAAQRRTDLRITINTTTQLPADQPFEQILHGHYRDWFSRYHEPPAEPGRLVYFGTIRRYKGVAGLITAFRQIPRTQPLTLRVAGRLSTGDLGASLEELAAGDDRISLSFDFLPDDQLVEEVGRAELVVLPYREMHNSGAALATLSLARPVLMPANTVNARLAEEVGPGWVHGYSGDLSGDDIRTTLEELRAHPPQAEPDLGARDWGRAGREHVAAYRRAVRIVRGRRYSSCA